MFTKLLTLVLLFSTPDVVEAGSSKYPKNRKIKLQRSGKSREFCIKHYGSHKYLYADTDENGNKVMMLGEKKLYDPKQMESLTNKMYWTYIESDSKLQIGFLESNDGKQLDINEKKNDQLTWHEIEKSPQLARGQIRFVRQGKQIQITQAIKQLKLTTIDDKIVNFSDKVATSGTSQLFGPVDCKTDKHLDPSFRFRDLPLDQIYKPEITYPGVKRMDGIDINNPDHQDYIWTASRLFKDQMKAEEDHEKAKAKSEERKAKADSQKFTDDYYEIMKRKQEGVEDPRKQYMLDLDAGLVQPDVEMFKKLDKQYMQNQKEALEEVDEKLKKEKKQWLQDHGVKSDEDSYEMIPSEDSQFQLDDEALMDSTVKFDL